MIFLNNEDKSIRKAKAYKIEKRLITPKITDLERKSVDRKKLLLDFINLLRTFIECSDFVAWNGITDGHTAYMKQKIRKQRHEIEDALLSFVNRWGLFGLMYDEAVFDHNKRAQNGAFILQGTPAYAIVEEYIDGISQYKRMEYDDYAESYFPNLNRPYPPSNIESYSEYINDIMNNKRFQLCLAYLEGIDKRNITSLEANINIKVTIKDLCPEFDVKPRSLIELCHGLLLINEIRAEGRDIGICHYRRCRTPYLYNGSMYCSPECMRNANKTRNGGKSNGKEKG